MPCFLWDRPPEKLSLVIKTTLFSACSVISTLLAASNEPRSMFNSSRSISIVTGRRIPFSFTLKLRLSRGIWREAILSLEIASWREHRNDKYERLLSGVPVQNRKKNYTKNWIILWILTKPCSGVGRQRSEGILVLSPTSRTPSMFHARNPVFAVVSESGCHWRSSQCSHT